ncbi:Zinc finger protein 830 [Amphibalanus amphitrite]|uniref:Zinc finger protein 830 n=1 Tax=Amphibalanus amphitrite TaxID=1232801 RepID=A0A6A4VBG7_AMPAM|nr:Zinc finger protein 830 [Amphibalanus amphitrite]
MNKGGSALPGDFFEKPQAPKKGILKNAPARPTYAPKAMPPPPPPTRSSQLGEAMDTDESGSNAHQPAGTTASVERLSAGGSSQPSGSGSAAGSTAPEPEVDTGQLPEGFFDDPQKDAKARHVEYVDPVEAEWEKFQREMQTEMAESEVILDEDQQEATVGRQIEEVDEQIRNLSRVVSMEKRKEELAHQEPSTSAQGDSSDSSADEAEVDEFLDWRSKGTWK